ncbi:type II secretion system F family protein [Microbacterium sp. JZ31]|uniref:type II secretion system F family protein n=1 Tax=Microbacterium sp. JZ31 TaxID=1906274 RepID=UPI001931CC71|nr:type II secretion system F family protein [Microbacterium sp. JZ31]
MSTSTAQAFDYVGRDTTGKRRRGTVDAPSKAAAMARVREMGITVTSVTESSILTREIDFSLFQKKISLREVSIAIRQISTMIDAGLTLVRGLSIIVGQIDNVRLRDVFTTVLRDIERGQPLSDAFAKRPDVFPPLLVHLVRAGEAGGFLADSLNSATDSFDADLKIRDTVKAALTYPVIVLCVAVLAVIAMLIFIVPVFQKMFADLGGDLPLPTQILVTLSENMIWLGPLLVVLVFGGVLWFRRYGHQPAVREAIDRARGKVPVLGPFFKQVAIARFTRTLSTTLSAGVPILQALAIVKQTAGSAVVEEAVGRVADGVRRGKSLAALIVDEPVFPPLVSQMVAVGEDTGALDSMLKRVADFTDREVQQTATRLTAMIEPLMVVLVGIIVGGMILSLYLPIFGVFDQIQQTG